MSRTDETNSGVSENVLLVGTLNILVVKGLGSLRVNPSDVKRTILQTAIEVLDQAHNVGELERSLNAERAIRLNLPTSTRRSERTDFSVSSDNDNLFKINKTSKLGELGGMVERLEFGEGEGEVCSGSDLDLSVDLLGLSSVSDLEVKRVVHSDCSTSRGGEGEVGANVTGKGCKVGDLVHSSVELDFFLEESIRVRNTRQHE